VNGEGGYVVMREEQRRRESGRETGGEKAQPMRPKLADWYVARFVSKMEVGSPESLRRQQSEGSSPGMNDQYFRDNTAVIESSFVGTDDFPLPDDRIRLSMFQPLKVLGRGGVGKVFLVLLVGTDKVYALKQLKKSEMILPNKVQRVMTEREIFKTTNHPFIVSLYASFQTRKKLYFVMEYCSGGEFFRVLQKQPNQRLSEEAAKFYAAEVILALEYLHCLGFVYRDLKPENVLMRTNGHVALTDFDLSKEGESQSPSVITKSKSGLSRMMWPMHSRSRSNSGKSKLFDFEIVGKEPVLPRSFSFVGTEEYIAPEVIEGKSQSGAVDWWTLGILIFEMLCGRTPFRGEGQTETFSRILHDDIIWPKDIQISTDCRNLLKKLLQKDPDRRLGKISGASELKKHKWFKGINFDLIRNESPPIKPKVRDPLDLAQYRPIREEFDVDEFELSDDEDTDNPFANFRMRKDQSTST